MSAIIIAVPSANDFTNDQQPSDFNYPVMTEHEVITSVIRKALPGIARLAIMTLIKSWRAAIFGPPL